MALVGDLAKAWANKAEAAVEGGLTGEDLTGTSGIADNKRKKNGGKGKWNRKPKGPKPKPTEQAEEEDPTPVNEPLARADKSSRPGKQRPRKKAKGDGAAQEDAAGPGWIEHVKSEPAINLASAGVGGLVGAISGRAVFDGYVPGVLAVAAAGAAGGSYVEYKVHSLWTVEVPEEVEQAAQVTNLVSNAGNQKNWQRVVNAAYSKWTGIKVYRFRDAEGNWLDKSQLTAEETKVIKEYGNILGMDEDKRPEKLRVFFAKVAKMRKEGKIRVYEEYPQLTNGF